MSPIRVTITDIHWNRIQVSHYWEIRAARIYWNKCITRLFWNNSADKFHSAHKTLDTLAYSVGLLEYVPLFGRWMPFFRKKKKVYQITEHHIRDGPSFDMHSCNNFTYKSNICICFIVCPCNMINKYLFIITNTMHTLGLDKITLFKTT